MSLRTEVSDIRVDYLQGSLERADLQDDPILQFEQWFQAAVKAEVNEPNAMSLGTVKNGQPSIRIVLLKGFDERGFVFYTNYNSRKGQEIAANTKAALTFFWPELERQIRIEGEFAKVSVEESDAYYNQRGKGSRIGAWASPQSEVIDGREALEEKVAELSQQYAETDEVPRPTHWGGYRVKPHYIEFWQGRKSRLHDRFAYRKSGNAWTIDRLAP
ncbi:MAG: pyridoxamine 5'-phosphate oxidase [Bacteroidota bacterium]